MKKPKQIFHSLLQTVTTTPEIIPRNQQEITPFEEKESPKHADGKSDLNAYSLFSAFTADIINEKTLFTR